MKKVAYLFAGAGILALLAAFGTYLFGPDHEYDIFSAIARSMTVELLTRIGGILLGAGGITWLAASIIRRFEPDIADGAQKAVGHDPVG